MLLCAVFGFVLNVLGTGMAGVALYRENGEHHGKSLLPTTEVAEWVRVRILRRPPRLTTVTSGRATGWAVFEGRATGMAKPATGAPWEEHIEHLWREIESIHHAQEQDRSEILGKLGAVNTALSERAGKAEERITLSEDAIRGMATGSFRMEVWGLILIGLGSAVSLWPTLGGWT